MFDEDGLPKSLVVRFFTAGQPYFSVSLCAGLAASEKANEATDRLRAWSRRSVRKIQQLSVDILMFQRYHQDVRTTLAFDNDIAAKLSEVAKKAGRPFKQVVNETLRLGLNAKRTMKPRKPFTVRTRDRGLRPGFELDCVSSLLEDLEGPPRR